MQLRLSACSRHLTLPEEYLGQALLGSSVPHTISAILCSALQGESLIPLTDWRVGMSEAFDNLSNFLQNEMQMSHIYQPAMLIHLLENGGHASTTSIAKAILLQDPTQVEYYEDRVREQPGKVLTENHGITEQIDDTYRLEGFEQLSPSEKTDLIAICHQRLSAYLRTSGDWRWSHRR